MSSTDTNDATGLTDQTLYVAVDAGTAEPFEFITTEENFEKLSEWCDGYVGRVYYEANVSDAEEIQKILDGDGEGSY